jgi:hypothetical protein
MRYLVSLCLMLCVCMFHSVDVQASDPVWYPCTSTGEGGNAADNAAFSIGMLGDFDGKSYWILQGRMDVPTSNYNYAFTLGVLKKNTQHSTLKLTAPSGGTMAMIDTLHINERHEIKRSFDRFVIDIEKKFNWGVERIICKAR